MNRRKFVLGSAAVAATAALPFRVFAADSVQERAEIEKGEVKEAHYQLVMLTDFTGPTQMALQSLVFESEDKVVERAEKVADAYNEDLSVLLDDPEYGERQDLEVESDTIPGELKAYSWHNKSTASGALISEMHVTAVTVTDGVRALVVAAIGAMEVDPAPMVEMIEANVENWGDTAQSLMPAEDTLPEGSMVRKDEDNTEAFQN